MADYVPRDAFRDKVVFVTGGGSGINLGIAKAFASLGAAVGICGRDAARLEGATSQIKELGARAMGWAADVRDFAALHEAIQASGQQLGAMDVLVCGAAIDFPFPAEQMSSDSFRKVIDTDLVGSFHASRAAFDQLRRTRGCVVFISGPQAFMPASFQCHVGAAKAGVDNLTKNLALEWGRFGIRCNGVSPGPIEETAGFRQLTTAEDYDKLKSFIPLGRNGGVEDVAAVAIFLASPLASFVTGVVVAVDGGHSLLGSGIYTAIMTDRLS